MRRRRAGNLAYLPSPAIFPSPLPFPGSDPGCGGSGPIDDIAKAARLASHHIGVRSHHIWRHLGAGLLKAGLTLPVGVLSGIAPLEVRLLIGACLPVAAIVPAPALGIPRCWGAARGGAAGRRTAGRGAIPPGVMPLPALSIGGGGSPGGGAGWRGAAGGGPGGEVLLFQPA